MKYTNAFDKRFSDAPEEVEASPLLSIVDFSEQWCDITLNLSQRVVLKLYAGEKLLQYPLPGYKISEQDWFDRQLAKNRFPRDVKDRLKEREGLGFQNILLVVGRRGTKSTTIAVATLYSVYKLVQHDNPQKYYGMQEGTPIEVAVAATSGEQSKRAPFKKISAICEEAVANKTPLAEWIEKDGIQTKTIHILTKRDRERRDELRKSGMRKPHYGTINIESYNSNSDSYRGGAVIAAIMDEFAQFQIHKQTGKDAAEYFWETLTPSVEQFMEDGRVFILSTPQGKVGKFYEIYKDVWAGNLKATIGLHMPSWEAWEDEPPERQRFGITRRSMADSDRNSFKWDYRGGESFEEAWSKATTSVKREFGAEFEGSEETWLNPLLIINPLNPNRGMIDSKLFHITQGVLGRVYVAHADAARKKDAFAICVLHKETLPEIGEVVIVDHLWRWKVAPDLDYVPRPYETVIFPEGPEPAYINSAQVKRYIQTDILHRFDVRYFTFDQVHSALFVDELAEYAWQKSLYTQFEDIATPHGFNKERSDLVESLLLEDRLKCYPHPAFEEEMMGLQKDKFGRIHKGEGLDDDMYDCVSIAAYHALEMPEYTDTHTRQGAMFDVEPLVIRGRL